MDAVLRIVDANFNRAREGLRVAEEAARFLLGDARLAAELKDLRHRVSVCLLSAVPRGLLATARDTRTDVGRRGERFLPAAPPEIVERNLLRAGEALRALEEYARAAAPGACPAFHAARFDLYDVEKRLLERLRPPLPLPAVIVRLAPAPGADSAARAARLARAGADAVRLEAPGGADGAFLRVVKAVRRALPPPCRLFVCGRPDIAAAGGADGVHLGRGDLPAPAVARAFPALIVTAARDAGARSTPGARFRDAGPVFSPRGIYLPDVLTAALKDITIPVIGIGGVTPENGLQPIRSGASGIVLDCPRDPCSAFEHALGALKQRMSAHGR